MDADHPANRVPIPRLFTGEAASQYAEAVGVAPVAVAATCTMESTCSSNPAANGTISGTFQMCQCRLHSPQIGRLKIPQFGAAAVHS